VSCGLRENPRRAGTGEAAPAESATPAASATPIRALSEIDLTKIGHVAPKGRVQDKEYNQLEVIEQLLAHGKESIPFLITRLDDQRVINGPVFDFSCFYLGQIKY
jgi:hypothetical protein